MPVQQIILLLIGVTGCLWFFKSATKTGSQVKRNMSGIACGFLYLMPILNAFQSLSSASSAELFGFIGCVLGLLGSARMISVNEVNTADKSIAKYAEDFSKRATSSIER